MNTYSNLTWKTFKVFLSSTFYDMDGERDYIKDILIPRLNNEMRQYSISIEICDLRSGLKTDDPNSDKFILSSCFQNINECDPFFIGLLGNRYGTQPNEDILVEFEQLFQHVGLSLDDIKGKSVTELEMILGVFTRDNTDAIFCIREDVEDDKEDVRLKDLKKYIRKHFSSTNKGLPDQLIEYTILEEESGVGRYKNLDKYLYNDLKEKIIRHAKLINNQNNQIRQNINVFVHEKNVNYLSTSFDIIGQNIIQKQKSFFIINKPGYGASSYLAHLYRELSLSLNKEKNLILYYSFEITDNPCTFQNMLAYWLKDDKETWESMDEKDDCNVHALAFKRFAMRKKQEGINIYMIIDGYDKVDIYDNPHATSFNWIPNDVYSYISISEDWYGLELIGKRGTLSMKPFSRVDMEKYIRSFGYNDLSKEIIDKALDLCYDNENAKDYSLPCSNPEYYKLLFQYVSDLDGQEFKQFRLKQNYYAALEEYQLSLIPEKLLTIESVFAKYYISKIRKYIGNSMDAVAKNAAFIQLLLLSYTQSGLRESDFNAVLKSLGLSWNKNLMNVMVYKFPDYVAYSSQTGIWNFKKPFVKRSLNTTLPSYTKLLYQKLLVHFMKLPQTDILVRKDLFFYLVHANDSEAAIEIIDKLQDKTLLKEGLGELYRGIIDKKTNEQYTQWIISLFEQRPTASTIDFILELNSLFDQTSKSSFIVDINNRVYNEIIENDFVNKGNDEKLSTAVLALFIGKDLFQNDFLEEALEYINRSMYLADSLKKNNYTSDKLEFLVQTLEELEHIIEEKLGQTDVLYEEQDLPSMEVLINDIIELQYKVTTQPSNCNSFIDLIKDYTLVAKLSYEKDRRLCTEALQSAIEIFMNIMERISDNQTFRESESYFFRLGVFFDEKGDSKLASDCFDLNIIIDKMLYDKAHTSENKKNLIASLHFGIKTSSLNHNYEQMDRYIQECKEIRKNENIGIDDILVFCEEQILFAERYKEAGMLEKAFTAYDCVCSITDDAMRAGLRQYTYIFLQNLIESAIILYQLDCIQDAMERLDVAIYITNNIIENAAERTSENMHARELRSDIMILNKKASTLFMEYRSKHPDIVINE